MLSKLLPSWAPGVIITVVGLLSMMSALSLAGPRTSVGPIYSFEELAKLIRARDSSVLAHDFWMLGRTVYYSYPGPNGEKYAWSFRFRVPGKKNEFAVPLTLARDPIAVALLRRLPFTAALLPEQQQPISLPNAFRLYRLRVVVYKKGLRFILQNSAKPRETNYVVMSSSSVDVSDSE